MAPVAGPDPAVLTGTFEAGATAGSATVEPFDPAVIEATGPDGSTYRLAIEAASVRQPTLVSLRPLSSVAFDGATLIAGVEIEPSGLQLFMPAVLTIVPAATSDETIPTAMEYTGSSDAAKARIAAVTAASSRLAYELVLTHFSGGIITSLTPDTETSLFLAHSASTNAPNTPEGRQARAETGLRTIRWAEEHGRMDSESARERTADYERDWWAAEADRVRNDPGLHEMITGGDPADADSISAEIARMVEAGNRVRDAGGEPGATSTEAFELAAQYGQNLANRLRSDPSFQATLTSGLVSDMAGITDMLGLLAGLAHQASVMGNSEQARAMFDAWREFFQKMATAIGASCSEAQITPELAYGLTRQAALLGQESVMSMLEKCLPTPPPCPEGFHGRLAVADPALLPGGGTLAADSCGPLKVTGTYTFQRTLIHDVDYPDGYVTYTESTTIQVRLRQVMGTGAAMSFEDDGSTLSYSANYSSPGSDELCKYQRDGTASGTFSANSGWIAASTGTLVDGSLAPLDLGYTFSYAGTHYFNGCGENETYVAEVWPFGCGTEHPQGLPVASSVDGTVFDFGCSDGAYIDPVDGSTSSVTHSGTMVLGP